MPLKKRTNHSKATPPSSPTTSTSHTYADHPHHPPRGHTSRPITSKLPPAPKRTSTSHLKDVVEEEDGEKKPKPVAIPPVGGSTKFARLVYVLVSIAVLLIVWYAYGMVTLLARLKDEVGWWGIVVGDSSTARSGRGMRAWEGFSPWLMGWGFGSGADRREGGDLEGSLNALADELGIDPVKVASAVRPLVPQATLTSVASKAGRTGRSEAVRVLFEDRSGYGARTIIQELVEDAAEGAVLD